MNFWKQLDLGVPFWGEGGSLDERPATPFLPFLIIMQEWMDGQPGLGPGQAIDRGIPREHPVNISCEGRGEVFSEDGRVPLTKC